MPSGSPLNVSLFCHAPELSSWQIHTPPCSPFTGTLTVASTTGFASELGLGGGGVSHPSLRCLSRAVSHSVHVFKDDPWAR